MLVAGAACATWPARMAARQNNAGLGGNAFAPRSLLLDLHSSPVNLRSSIFDPRSSIGNQPSAGRFLSGRDSTLGLLLGARRGRDYQRSLRLICQSNVAFLSASLILSTYFRDFHVQPYVGSLDPEIRSTFIVTLLALICSQVGLSIRLGELACSCINIAA